MWVLLSYRIPRVYHHVLALFCLATNVLCTLVEFRAISRNGRLIDQILATVHAGP